ncbi:MAG: phosphate ABC transporter permease subunit PstC [Gemmatimonadaceae bacterium]|jgi:phosphate transport system permease protein|nr:phosphate ABC transporter permease subunit PstC [Gemmatimonadaceae bacterium]
MIGAGDRAWRATTGLAALAIPAALGLVTLVLGIGAWPVLRDAAIPLVTSRVWDPGGGTFGAGAALVGTLLTSGLAVCIAAPLGVATALYTVELAGPRLARVLASLTDVLAAIPSVVYGLWGASVLVPLLRSEVLPVLKPLGRILPLFAGPANGPSLLAAALLLALMILPYVTAVSREVIAAVPRSQREAALALGATRWEMLRDAVLPGARTGILGGIALALGRALGETMAVTMVIGNRHDLSWSLLSPGYTLASLLANEFGEASGDRHLAALMAVALVLLAVTLLVNAVARGLVRSARSGRSSLEVAR